VSKPADALPTITSDIPRDLRTYLDRLRGLLNQTGGIVTADDLKSYKLIDANGQPVDNSTGGSNEPVEYGAPAVVANLNADGAFQNIIVTWTQPDYYGHAFTEIWGSPTYDTTLSSGDPGYVDPTTYETFDSNTATLVGITAGSVFSDNVGGATGRYYWARNINLSGREGAFNSATGANGETAVDLDFMFETLADSQNVPAGALPPLTVVDTAYTTAGGTTVPTGVYITDGFIRNAAIGTAQIENLAVDEARVANGAITNLKVANGAITNLKISGIIKSDATATGTGDPLWSINKNGGAQFRSILVEDDAGNVVMQTGPGLSGNEFIDGVYITDGSITNLKIGNVIESTAQATNGGPKWYINKDGRAIFRNIEIRDDDNTLLLQSGGNIDFSRVVNAGDMANIDSIDSTNVSTYIDNLAIGTVQIANGAVTNKQVAFTSTGVTLTDGTTYVKLQELVDYDTTGNLISIIFNFRLADAVHTIFELRRGTTVLREFTASPGFFYNGVTTSVVPTFITFACTDQPSAGTYTYSVWAKKNDHSFWSTSHVVSQRFLQLVENKK